MASCLQVSCADGGHYCFLGLRSAPVEHVRDIIRLKVKKMGVTPASARIFIRAWQKVNDWECRALMRLSDAFITARSRAVPSRPGARPGGKRG